MDSDESNHNDMSFYEHLVHCIWVGDNEEAIQILQEMDSYDMKNDISGGTLLHEAVESNNQIITRYLIDAGCKIDAVDNDGNTPLILACTFNYTDIIKLLIEAKASVLISNNKGENAAKIVLGGLNMNVLIIDPILESVKEECSNDSLQTAKELLKIGCTLTRAMRLRDTALTEHILERSYNINHQDPLLQSWTPLHQALVFKDNENAKLLIDRGADVNIQDDAGITPVGYAGNFQILEILLNKGARMVDDFDCLVAPSLFYSWERSVVEMLIERYNLRDFSIDDILGTSLFHHIVSNEVFDPVDILQKHFDDSFDINQKGHGGSTPLLNAIKAGNVGTVEFLLKKGANVNIANRDGHPGVYYAVIPHARKNNREDREIILMLLLQYGADIQWTGRDQWGQEYFTLESVLRRKNFAMAKIILARLALVEDMGGEIKNLYRQKIEDTPMCKKYFEFCKQAIEKLKRTVIKRGVTLFEFMTCSEETLVKFARSEEFVETVQSMMYHKRNSNLYYYKVLRQRVKKAVEVVVLRRGFFSYINDLIPELESNQIVIEKIVEYIIHDVSCIMARQPTFKCIIHNV